VLRKVIIIGCPGAGKSTFARILSDKTHLPLYYLDMLWHKPDRTTVERNIFDNKLKEIVLGDKWIIDFPKNELYRHIQNQSVLSFHIRVLNV
jgi:adenylate kinase family enzyme